MVVSRYPAPSSSNSKGFDDYYADDVQFLHSNDSEDNKEWLSSRRNNNMRLIKKYNLLEKIRWIEFWISVACISAGKSSHKFFLAVTDRYPNVITTLNFERPLYQLVDCNHNWITGAYLSPLIEILMTDINEGGSRKSSELLKSIVIKYRAATAIFLSLSIFNTILFFFALLAKSDRLRRTSLGVFIFRIFLRLLFIILELKEPHMNNTSTYLLYWYIPVALCILTMVSRA